jgi:tetratricopeptide (TPR) repeat protein
MGEFEVVVDLGPENEQQLAHLRRAMALGVGFQLILLEVAQPELETEVLRRLQRWSGTEGVPPLAFVVTTPGTDPVEALKGAAGASQGAVLIGLERPASGAPPERHAAPGGLAGDDAIGQSMSSLNWQRDDLPLQIQGPLVLLLSPDGVRQLFVCAPDLVTWRMHTTRVTAPRPDDLELRPWPSRRAALEEKAWLEQMLAESASGLWPFVWSVPGWLLRLGEIEARIGDPWQQRFALAEQLAGEQRDILFKLALARARRALEEGRYDDAEIQEGKAAELISGSLDTKQERESTRAAAGRGTIQREVGWGAHYFAELRVIRAERLLRTGDVEQATNEAETALTSARASGDLALVITALGISGAIASHRGDRAEARSRFEEIRDVARVARDPDAELFALTRLLEIAPEVALARTLALQALELAEDPAPRALVYIALARQEITAGALDEAERTLAQTGSEAELPPRICRRLLTARKELAAARR